MRTVALTLLFSAAITATASSIATAEIAWNENLRSAHAQAQAENKLLLLHFYSDNCVFCDRLEEGAFQVPAVNAALTQNYVPVKIHAGKNPQLVEMFHVTKFPTDVIVTTAGKTLSHSVSPQAADRYIAMLQTAVPKAGSPTAPAPQAPAAAAPAVEAVAQQAPAATAPAATAPAAAATPPQTAAIPAAAPNSPAQFPGGAQGILAGARTDGMTLGMPAQLNPEPASPAAETEAVPAIDTAPEIAAATETTTAPESKPTATDKSGQPELAMEGFCAVTVIKEDRWIEGRSDFGAIHLGKLYLFASAEAMETFLADPVTYTPVLNEIDVVRFFEERRIVPGKREWGLKDPTHNRMFFFADEAAMNHFWNEHHRYADAAIKVMDQAVKDANPGT